MHQCNCLLTLQARTDEEFTGQTDGYLTTGLWKLEQFTLLGKSSMPLL